MMPNPLMKGTTAGWKQIMLTKGQLKNYQNLWWLIRPLFSWMCHVDSHLFIARYPLFPAILTSKLYHIYGVSSSLCAHSL